MKKLIRRFLKWILEEDFQEIEKDVSDIDIKIINFRSDVDCMESAISNKIDNISRKIDSAVDHYRDSRRNLNQAMDLTREVHDTITEIVDVAVDVYPDRDPHSWAVICLHGKREYVRFVDMSSYDMRSIESFLKQFQERSRVVDSPFQMPFCETTFKF